MIPLQRYMQMTGNKLVVTGCLLAVQSVSGARVTKTQFIWVHYVDSSHFNYCPTCQLSAIHIRA